DLAPERARVASPLPRSTALRQRTPGGPVAHRGNRDCLVARTGAVGELPVPEQTSPPVLLEQRTPARAERVRALLHLPALDLVHLVQVDHGGRHSGGASRPQGRRRDLVTRVDFLAPTTAARPYGLTRARVGRWHVGCCVPRHA